MASVSIDCRKNIPPALNLSAISPGHSRDPGTATRLIWASDIFASRLLEFRDLKDGSSGLGPGLVFAVHHIG